MSTGADSSVRFLEAIRSTLVTYQGVAGQGMAVSDVAKIARIEPITLISANLSGQKELYNILHGVLNIYTAYTLQAVHILSAQLADVRILKILDKVNPDRDMKTLLTSGYIAVEGIDLKRNLKTLSLEGCKYALPKLSAESIFNENDDEVLTNAIGRLETFEKLGSAVGKVVEVRFNSHNKDAGRTDEVTIPLVVKLDNMIIPGEVVASLLTSNAENIRLGSRFKDAITGRIGFIKDFLLCSDLIKSQKKTMMKDPTGAYATLLKRVNNSKIYSALSGNISLAGISSILVLSEEDEQLIQRKIGGKLTNENTRKIVFDNTSAAFIVVIDQEWERVTIYVRDQSGFSQNSFSSFKNSTDSSSDNITEMLKVMSMGGSGF